MAKIILKKKEKIKKFLETTDPFVDYVLEDVWVRRMVGEGAIRCRRRDEETLELIAMNEKALDRVLELFKRGEFRLRITKLRRPTPEDFEKWLAESKELKSLPGFDEDEE